VGDFRIPLSSDSSLFQIGMQTATTGIDGISRRTSLSAAKQTRIPFISGRGAGFHVTMHGE
jgi:hypothetical protein